MEESMPECDAATEILCYDSVDPDCIDCTQPADCDEFGSGCAPDEFCVPMEEGCPPPPVYCDFETEEMCYTPPPADCMGAACWGTEFCAPMDPGCPMPPLDCMGDQVQCADPPPPDCPDCMTAEYCMPMDMGCPPPPTYCDWATEVMCYEPPMDCNGDACWPAEFCAPI